MVTWLSSGGSTGAGSRAAVWWAGCMPLTPESPVVEIIGNGSRLWVTSESELRSPALVCWSRDMSHSKFTNTSITVIVTGKHTAGHSYSTAPHLAVRELGCFRQSQSLFFFYWGDYELSVTFFKTWFMVCVCSSAVAAPWKQGFLADWLPGPIW